MGMSNRFRLASRSLAVLGLSMTARIASAQQLPEQVVDSAFHAIARRNWSGLAELMAPEAFDRARQEHLGMLILVAEQRRAGEKVGGGYNSDQVVIADHIATVGSTKAVRFGNATIAELAALPPDEFYVRWLDAAYAPGRANGVEDIVDRERIIIGSVTAGDTAWVVYREDDRWQEGNLVHVMTPGSPDILPLRRVAGRWRILPNFELAHGPDITGMFDESRMPRLPAPTRRVVEDRPFARAGSPRYADAVPSPVVVVDSAFDALARKDWSRLTMLVDSRMLADFQSRQIQELVALLTMQKIRAAKDSPSGMTIGLTLGDSNVAAAGNERVEVMRGHPTINELRRLPPAEFFVRWCEAAYGSASSGDAPVERQYVGSVFEGEDIAHVLYRSSVVTFDLPAQVMRMPLRYADGHWRILLNDEIGGRFALAMALDR